MRPSLKWLLRLLGLLAFVLVVYAGYRLIRPVPEAPQSAVVRRGSIEATISALGRVVPSESRDLVPRASGQVLSLSVQEGDHVEAGQELFRIDDSELARALDQAEEGVALRQERLLVALEAPDASSIAIARAQLLRATALRQNAQDDYDALQEEEIDPEGSDEAVDLQSARLQYELAQAEYDRVMAGPSESDILALRAELSSAESNLLSVRERIERTVVRAPIEGTLIRLDLEMGEWVFANNAVGQIADLGTPIVQAEVGELDVPQLVLDQPTHVRFDAFPGEQVEGRLTYLPAVLDESLGAPVYRVEVTLESHSLALRPGMGAGLLIVLEARRDVLVIPRRALGQVGARQVVTVLAGRRNDQRIVETGLSNNIEVQVVSGLQEGEIVRVD